MTERTVIEELPSSQYIILEVLAARHRLGDRLWTFRTRDLPSLRALESIGLISIQNGVIERTVRARLTDAGRAAALSEDYTPWEPAYIRPRYRAQAELEHPTDVENCRVSEIEALYATREDTLELLFVVVAGQRIKKSGELSTTRCDITFQNVAEATTGLHILAMAPTWVRQFAIDNAPPAAVRSGLTPPTVPT